MPFVGTAVVGQEDQQRVFKRTPRLKCRNDSADRSVHFRYHRGKDLHAVRLPLPIHRFVPGNTRRVTRCEPSCMIDQPIGH